MWTLIALLFWLAVAAGVLALYGLLAGRFLQVDAQPDSIHFATTSDGWRLALSRYRAATPLAGAPPVLLCPGLALSSRLFDLGAERSLARYLARHGYQSWVLDWRGRGASERPRLWGGRRFNWCFDDHVGFDLPAALEAVAAETGAPRLLGVGFGLGGLALLCAAGGAGAGRLGGVAGIGCAAFFRRAASELPGWWLGLAGRLRLEAVVRIASPLLGRFFPGPLAALQNRDAIAPALYRRALVNAVCSLSPRETRQVKEWFRRDLPAGLGEEGDYRRLLGRVSVPVLLLGGVRDRLAPPEAVEQTAGAMPAAERQIIQASRLQGMTGNYGHLDLLLGSNADRDVFPHLLRWLDSHSGVEVPAARPQPPRGDLPWPEPLAGTAPSALAGPGTAMASPAKEPLPSRPEQAPAGELFAVEAGEAAEEEGEDIDWLAGDVPRVPR